MCETDNADKIEEELMYVLHDAKSKQGKKLLVPILRVIKEITCG